MFESDLLNAQESVEKKMKRLVNLPELNWKNGVVCMSRPDSECNLGVGFLSQYV